MNIFLKVIVFSTIISITGCEQVVDDQWEGFVYPDKNNLLEHTNIGVHSSLKSCRAASLDMLSSISTIENGDYECGLNCTSKNEFKIIKTCEKTER